MGDVCDIIREYGLSVDNFAAGGSLSRESERLCCRANVLSINTMREALVSTRA